jgi:hypothetical protein
VSDEHNSLARQPTIGSRRVSVFVAVPVVIGCAVLGSVIGTTHPLQSMFSATRPGGELSDLRLSSVRSVEPPAVAPEPSRGPSSGPHGAVPAVPPGPAVTGPQDAARVPARPATSVVTVSTGSVDRPLPAGGSGDVPATQGNPTELVPPEGASRATTQGHRQARAKRLRRMLGRHTRPKSAGAQVDAFISSILPAK